MSRVGKKKIVIPDNVNVVYEGSKISVKGEKGILYLTLNPLVGLLLNKNIISVIILKNNKNSSALQGLTRTLISNMIEGVSVGFIKKLEVNGIGYKAEIKNEVLVLSIGYSHLVNFKIPKDIEITVDKNIINLYGIDKGKLGQVASSIRQLRPPEPYKAKGIKYFDEYIRRKAGKTTAK